MAVVTPGALFLDLLPAITPPDIHPLDNHLHSTSCTPTRTWTVALCPGQFAGRGAEHNMVFTVGQLPRALQERRWGQTERKGAQ